MTATVKTTQRKTGATRMEHPVLENLKREPQMADAYGHLENVALDQRANFPHIGYTECLIWAVRQDGGKYGENKEKLFPSAARLQAVRMLLESVRDGTTLGQPAGVDSNKWNSFTSDTPKIYALDEQTGDLIRLGTKSGYAVPREKIHKVLVWAHEVTEHAGRDKLYGFLGQYYSVDCFPKEFVECWLAACPGHTHRAVKEPQATSGPKVSLKKRAHAIWKQEGYRHVATSGPDRLAMRLANEDPITRALLGLPEPPREPLIESGMETAMEIEQIPVNQQAEVPAVQTAPENINPDDALRAVWDDEYDIFVRQRASAGQGQAIQDVPVVYPFQTMDNLPWPVQQFHVAGPSTAENLQQRPPAPTANWEQHAPRFNFPVPMPLTDWQMPPPGFENTQPTPILDWQQPPSDLDIDAMDFDWETGQVVVRMPMLVQVPTVPGPVMWNPNAGIDPAMLWL